MPIWLVLLTQSSKFIARISYYQHFDHAYSNGVSFEIKNLGITNRRLKSWILPKNAENRQVLKLAFQGRHIGLCFDASRRVKYDGVRIITLRFFTSKLICDKNYDDKNIFFETL